MKADVENLSDREVEAVAARWVARRDAGLSPADAAELQRWLDADPRHRRALGFYDSAWSALAKPTRAGAGDELELQLAAMARRRSRRRTMATTAAAFAVLLGVSLVRWTPPERAGEKGPSATAAVVLPARQTLPDGSTVELKAGAQIAVAFTAETRRIIFKQGEAYFTVQKDPARPFVVSAGGVDVRAVGTEFSVQINADVVEVLVTEGTVALDKPADASAPLLARVDAGKRAMVDITSAAPMPEVETIAQPQMNSRLAWRSPRLEFTRTPLGEAVALLNQHAADTAARLILADGDVAATRVSGVFRADNTDAFVLLLEGAFGVKAERSGNTITLRKAR